MPQDITLKITDRNGQLHEVLAPTDMNLNIMELIRMYELAEEGTVGVCGGMAMCASCQCYVLNDKISLERNSDEEAMLGKPIMSKTILVLVVKFLLLKI